VLCTAIRDIGTVGKCRHQVEVLALLGASAGTATDPKVT